MAKRKTPKRGKLIPLAKRQPLAVRMHKTGARPTDIADALGFTRGYGTGMVKRLLVTAGLRKK